jgi:hypothetical protein
MTTNGRSRWHDPFDESALDLAEGFLPLEQPGRTATMAAAQDELVGLIRELKDNLDNIPDQRQVEAMVQQAVAATFPKSGYRPHDSGDGPGSNRVATDVDEIRHLQGRERVEAAILRSPVAVAEATGRTLDDVQHFQQTSDELLLLTTILGAHQGHPVDPHETRFFTTRFQKAVQAMDTATTAEGTEYVPRWLSGTLIDRIQNELMVARLFPTIDMPTNPYDIGGFSVSRLHSGKLAENTADTGQTLAKKITAATRKVTLTAVKLAVEAIISRELEEDAIIPMLPFLQGELVDYIVADYEDAIVNGDTTGTHMDSDVTAADDPRKLWVGLRKSVQTGQKTDASASPLTVAMLRINRKNMRKYGTRGDRLAHIVSVSGYVQLLSDPSVITLEKYGPQATILTGELGRVDNVPVIVSDYLRTDLNASGVFDNTTTTRSLALTVHTGGFMSGYRRGITIQVLRELYAESDQDAIIATYRPAFTARYPNATEPTIAAHYNLST